VACPIGQFQDRRSEPRPGTARTHRNGSSSKMKPSSWRPWSRDQGLVPRPRRALPCVVHGLIPGKP
jgi:hypothetical protein